MNENNMDTQMLFPWSKDSMLEIFIDDEDFLKIKETLTRIGITSHKGHTLSQTCLILKKMDKYYIVHFKEMFFLDRRPSTLTVADIKKRNVIATLLEQWDLLDIAKDEFRVNDSELMNSVLSQLCIVKFADKDNWTLESKYTIGRAHRRGNPDKD